MVLSTSTRITSSWIQGSGETHRGRMTGFILKDFFRCKALKHPGSAGHHGWSRKRKKLLPLPALKRRRVDDDAEAFALRVRVDDGNPHEEKELDMQSDISSGDESEKEIAPQGVEQPNLYPSVVYEGKKCTVSLGIGQVVILDGCAMVQVIEGQASMLGYFLPCGVDVLVCSNSKLAEAVSIEPRCTPAVGDANMTDGCEKRKGEDILGCILRFTSHILGKQTLTSDSAADGTFSFKLDFLGPLGRCPQRKRGRDDFEDRDEKWESAEEINDLDAEISSSDDDDDDAERDDVEEALKLPVEGLGMPPTSGVFKKRRNIEALTSNVKRPRSSLSGSSSAATILPQTWRDAVDSIMLEHSTGRRMSAGKNWLSSCSYAPVVAICGARNVGKSTFARFLVNSLLNRHKQVAYLDTDIGQPEFTVPGCISLHILDQPIVGPPAMHLRTPERCFFYGDISPKSDPILYSQNVADLNTHFQQQYCNDGRTKMPLVINTHGWVKGIGYDVVADILRCTSPTHVVQLLTNSGKKDLPPGRFWDESSEAETFYIESAIENLATEAKLFAQKANSLVNEAPYQVPITALTIKHLHSEGCARFFPKLESKWVPPSQSLRAINASIVGLAVSSADKQTMEQYSLPLCIGVGIVKAVDVQKGIFHICTPVPMDQLQQVTTLLQGCIETPVPLLMEITHCGRSLCSCNEKYLEIGGKKGDLVAMLLAAILTKHTAPLYVTNIASTTCKLFHTQSLYVIVLAHYSFSSISTGITEKQETIIRG